MKIAGFIEFKLEDVGHVGFLPEIVFLHCQRPTALFGMKFCTYALNFVQKRLIPLLKY